MQWSPRFIAMVAAHRVDPEKNKRPLPAFETETRAIEVLKDSGIDLFMRVEVIVVQVALGDN